MDIVHKLKVAKNNSTKKQNSILSKLQNLEKLIAEASSDVASKAHTHTYLEKSLKGLPDMFVGVCSLSESISAVASQLEELDSVVTQKLLDKEQLKVSQWKEAKRQKLKATQERLE
mmetsp:Transcript_6707/g.9897  ORF Transcript_6707/g.9897 Transcript_6707/m.9897 type:complete len:116 (+) Transcript_6707:1351-1698(+)